MCYKNINKYRKFASYIGRLQEDKKQVVTVTTANMIYNKTNLLKTNTNILKFASYVGELG